MRSITKSIIAIVLVLSTASFANKYSGGTGESNDPYQIASAADLLEMAANTGDYGAHFILTANIDLGGQVFTKAIIAANTDSGYQFHGTEFTGVFDGNRHNITNFTINSGTDSYLGLFGYVGSGGQVKNLGVEDVNVTGHYYYVGGLVGCNFGSNVITTGCHANGSVSGDYLVGGLVGYNRSSNIISCYAACSVTGKSAYVGGLVGAHEYGSITSCYATGSVSGNGTVGGLIGSTYNGSVNSSYSTGTVTGTSDYIGGLVGYHNGWLYNCFWDIQTSGTSDGVGNFDPDPTSVIGKNTVEMKKLSTFTNAGWDFSATDGDPADWKMLSNDYPRLVWEGMIVVQKCSLAAGKDNLDSISIAGLFDATNDDFVAAMTGNLVVTINSNTMSSPRTFTFPITPATYKKGKFSGKIINTSFSFDTKKHKFAFAAKKTNLTGLSCPLTVTITIGGYAARTQLEEAIVNGKKPTPFQLMMGVQNNLTVTKYKLKSGKVLGTDTLTAQGIFTIDGIFDITKEFVITIGSQSFTVPENSFFSKSGSFSCKNIPVTGGFVTAKLDTNKCTFTLSITKANITQTGEVDFGINCFGNNLNGLETIDLY